MTPLLVAALMPREGWEGRAKSGGGGRLLFGATGNCTPLGLPRFRGERGVGGGRDREGGAGCCCPVPSIRLGSNCDDPRGGPVASAVAWTPRCC